MEMERLFYDFMQLPEHEDLLGLSGKRKGFEIFGERTLPYVPRTLSPIMPPPRQQAAFFAEMAGVGDETKTAVYVHIPFCRQRCSYCGFFGNSSNLPRQDRYVDLVCREMELVRKTAYVRRRKVSAVFIGGGSPSALTGNQLDKLLKKINEVFLLDDACEFTFESNIADFDETKLAICLKYKVNRFSFGVQTFATDLRRQLGRSTAQAAVVEKLKFLSHKGADVIVDLIYGLPGQTLDSLKKDLELLADCNTAGVDLYKLQHFKGSLLEENLKKGIYAPCPDKAGLLNLYQEGAAFLQRQGWTQLTCCHFTREGKDRSLYNNLAKNGGDILGFGAGAGGGIGGLEYMQNRDLNIYEERIGRGEKPFAMALKRDRHQSFFAKLSGQLDGGILELDLLEEKYRLGFKAGILLYMNLWEKNGLCNVQGERVELTLLGKYWVRYITRALLCAMQYAAYGPEKKVKMPGAMMSGMMNLE